MFGLSIFAMSCIGIAGLCLGNLFFPKLVPRMELEGLKRLAARNKCTRWLLTFAHVLPAFISGELVWRLFSASSTGRAEVMVASVLLLGAGFSSHPILYHVGLRIKYRDRAARVNLFDPKERQLYLELIREAKSALAIHTPNRETRERVQAVLLSLADIMNKRSEIVAVLCQMPQADALQEALEKAEGKKRVHGKITRQLKKLAGLKERKERYDNYIEYTSRVIRGLAVEMGALKCLVPHAGDTLSDLTNKLSALEQEIGSLEESGMETDDGKDTLELEGVEDVKTLPTPKETPED